MGKPLFVWLGSGRAKRRRVGEKGRLLDEAARAGLPVPAGAVLLDEFFQLALKERLAVRDAGHLWIPDPELLHNTLFLSVRLPEFDRPVAVRAAFSVEQDGQRRSAGGVAPCLGVRLSEPQATARALESIWSAALSPEPTARRDVLLIEMVDEAVSGNVTSYALAEQDSVTCSAAGNASVREIVLPRLRPWRRAAEDLPPFAQRLQMLLRGLRRTLGDGDWVVDWIDDGRICWLTQARLAANPVGEL